MLVAGGAHLLIQGEVAARSLMPGDYLFLPAGCRHRVEWTDLARETVWLAVHIGKDAAGGG
jgi:cupin 2 domain-containing protein